MCEKSLASKKRSSKNKEEMSRKSMSLGIARSRDKEFYNHPPQYQEDHQNMPIIPPMLDTDLLPCL